jgi:hypothetical protein
MAFYIGNPPKQVIDNSDDFEIAVYSTRAQLPIASVQGYMAYVQDQEELVINTGNTVYPNPQNTQSVPLVASPNPVSIDYLIVAGGGGGVGTSGTSGFGGGGAGGFLTGGDILCNNQNYTVVIGAGGGYGVNGWPSSFKGIVAIGGGYGNGAPGGSGGGAVYGNAGGLGTPGQGHPGGAGYYEQNYYTTGGGGGGAGSAGTNSGPRQGGCGGAGRNQTISGVSKYYAGGGGGGVETCGTGGSGGIGGGGYGSPSPGPANGTANTGGGGGGGGSGTGTGGSGGSGVIIIAYCSPQKFTGGVVTSSGGKTIHTFDSSDLLTSIPPPAPTISVNYLIVGGGGGGGSDVGGGGGGGGFITGTASIAENKSFTIKVGTGGTGAVSTGWGFNGGSSSFNGVTACGGGGGGGGTGQLIRGRPGGSGGGGSAKSNCNGFPGLGVPGQGTPGALGSGSLGGGGGGAASQGIGEAGGSGQTSSITGSSQTFSGGGGGGGSTTFICTGAVSYTLHSAGDYGQGYSSSPTYSVTNNGSSSLNVTISVTFFYGSHVQTDSRIYRSDDTLLYNTGSIDWNFNVVYHSTQYRTYSVTDSIPANTTYGYYASMATFYNGDHDYSIGPDGMYSMSVTQTYGGAGGTGGGGIGGGVGNVNGASGIAYSGGGGGGGGDGTCNGGSGGTGVVIISYCGSQIFTGGIVTTSGGKTIHKFTSDGVLSPAISATSSPDLNVTWYKLLEPSTTVQQSGRLDQGTLQGGYNSIVNWNTIHQIQFSTDTATLRPETTPWASRYSTAMSSKFFAYYHAGMTGPNPSADGNVSNQQTCRQSWTTFTVSLIASTRPDQMAGGRQVTLYSTSNLNNNYGIMQYPGYANYFIFATDTTTTMDQWYENLSGPDNNYNQHDFRDPDGNNAYGLSANGPVNGYVNWYSVSKFNWSSKNWTSLASAGPAPNSQGGGRGGHSTPYNKFYYGGGAGGAGGYGGSSYIDIFNTAVELWNTGGGTLFPLFSDDSRFSNAGGSRSNGVEMSAIPGQDWGYWYAMWSSGANYTLPIQYQSYGVYTNLSQKTFYATDTTIWSPATDLAYYAPWATSDSGKNTGGVISGNSASGCSGPSS